jgi:hypothetical protein
LSVSTTIVPRFSRSKTGICGVVARAVWLVI